MHDIPENIIHFKRGEPVLIGNRYDWIFTEDEENNEDVKLANLVTLPGGRFFSSHVWFCVDSMQDRIIVRRLFQKRRWRKTLYLSSRAYSVLYCDYPIYSCSTHTLQELVGYSIEEAMELYENGSITRIKWSVPLRK